MLVDSTGAKQDKEFRVEAAEVVGECDPEVSRLQYTVVDSVLMYF